MQSEFVKEGQKIQGPKEKGKRDKQRNTKTKDRATQILLKAGCELKCSRRISSSCYTSGTHRVTSV